MNLQIEIVRRSDLLTVESKNEILENICENYRTIDYFSMKKLFMVFFLQFVFHFCLIIDLLFKIYFDLIFFFFCFLQSS